MYKVCEGMRYLSAKKLLRGVTVSWSYWFYSFILYVHERLMITFEARPT